MFDVKAEITELVDTLYAVTENLDRGEILTHDVIAEVLGLMPHEGSWGHVVGKVRRRLRRERGIATWFVRGIGYKLLTKHEQCLAPLWHERKAIRSKRRGIVDLSCLSEEGLTLHQRRFRSVTLEQLIESERAACRELNAQEKLLRPVPVLPRRNLMNRD
jgi:hypothetical protein